MKKDKHRKIHQCKCQECHQHPYSTIAKEHKAINRLLAELDEKNRRRVAGLLVQQWGRGGVKLLQEITGLSRTTIGRGRIELEHVDHNTKGRARRAGGGRSVTEKKSRRF
jgi:hypothetical protein